MTKVKVFKYLNRGDGVIEEACVLLANVWGHLAIQSQILVAFAPLKLLHNRATLISTPLQYMCIGNCARGEVGGEWEGVWVRTGAGRFIRQSQVCTSVYAWLTCCKTCSSSSRSMRY